MATQNREDQCSFKSRLNSSSALAILSAFFRFEALASSRFFSLAIADCETQVRRISSCCRRVMYRLRASILSPRLFMSVIRARHSFSLFPAVSSRAPKRWPLGGGIHCSQNLNRCNVVLGAELFLLSNFLLSEHRLRDYVLFPHFEPSRGPSADVLLATFNDSLPFRFVPHRVRFAKFPESCRQRIVKRQLAENRRNGPLETLSHALPETS